MLGYAPRPADLALGATIEELRTGDIARRTPEGLYEIIGRSGRFVKLFGLRIDLDRVQRGLAERGVTALCTDDVDALAVAAVDTGKASTHEVRQLTAALADIPAGSVRATVVPELPRLISGKPDYAAVHARRRTTGHRCRGSEGLVRRGAACTGPMRRSRRQLHRPGWKFVVLRGDVGSAGAGPGTSAEGLAG